MDDTIYGYHFTGQTLRDGRPLPHLGVWLEHDGALIPCEEGLHMSEHPFDALRYAPGPLLHRVELGGTRMAHGNPPDKWVGQRRRILASHDATALCQVFARWCASRVLPLWDAPEIVQHFLATGDQAAEAAEAAEAARDAAWAAARAAAGDAAGAAESAAGAAAWAAARAAWAAETGAQRQRFQALVNAAFAAQAARDVPQT